MTRFVEANGIRIHIVDEGTGPLVVLLHGFPEIAATWRHQIRALVAAGYRVVAPDQRGFGQTDQPEREDAYTMLHLVGDVIGLIDALGEAPAVVVGHDWGAPIAWHCALLRPDRVRAVVGMSVPLRSRSQLPPVAAMRRLFGDGYYMAYFQTPGVAERDFAADVRGGLRRWMYATSADAAPAERWTGKVDGDFFRGVADPHQLPAWLDQAHLDDLTTAFTRTGFRGGLSWYRNLDRNWELLAPFTGLAIHQPAMFLAGEHDGSYLNARAALDGFPKLIPGLRKTVIVPGAGHWVGEERPAAVNAALLEFLAGL